MPADLYRDTLTGRFVSVAEAASRDPGTVVAERVPQCRTCAAWKLEPGTNDHPHGICTRASGHTLRMFVSYTSSPHVGTPRVSLFTEPDFGCLEWEG